MIAEARHLMVRLSVVPRIVEKITGERPNTATVYRWHQRGLKGVRLRTAFAGGQRRTCEAWVRQFFDDVTAAVDGKDAQSLGRAHRQQIAETAEAWKRADAARARQQSELQISFGAQLARSTGCRDPLVNLLLGDRS